MAERIPVPAHIAATSGLEKVDYQDAFTAHAHADRAPEHLLRLALREAPRWLRRLVRAVQGNVLGLRLGPPDSSEHPLGWRLLRNDSSAVVLGVEGGLLTPRIVVTVRERQVVVATVVRYDHVAARPVWAVIAPLHRAVARRLVDGGVRAAADGRSC